MLITRKIRKRHSFTLHIHCLTYWYYYGIRLQSEDMAIHWNCTRLLNFSLLRLRSTRIFENSRSHLKMLGAKKWYEANSVLWTQLGVMVRNLVARVTWRLGFVYPCSRWHNLPFPLILYTVWATDSYLTNLLTFLLFYLLTCLLTYLLTNLLKIYALESVFTSWQSLSQ